MRKKFLVVFAICIICFAKSYAQLTDSITKYKSKIFDGYFILIRDSIPKTDRDVTLPIMDFNIFYVQSIDNNTLECLKLINRPAYDSLSLISFGINSSIANPQEHKQYIYWLIKNGYFEKTEKGSLYDGAQIPKYLINSNKRFVSVFKGKCTVVGPFYPNNKLQLINQHLYMCLPFDSNDTKYMYSFIFE